MMVCTVTGINYWHTEQYMDSVYCDRDKLLAYWAIYDGVYCDRDKLLVYWAIYG